MSDLQEAEGTTSQLPVNSGTPHIMNDDAQRPPSVQSVQDGEASQRVGEASQRSVSELPPETLDFAAKCFELARKGDEATLGLYLDAGLPPNLTNSQGAYLFQFLP